MPNPEKTRLCAAQTKAKKPRPTPLALKILRLTAGLTPDNIAALVGMPPRSWGNLEAGRSTLSVERWERLQHILATEVAITMTPLPQDLLMALTAPSPAPEVVAQHREVAGLTQAQAAALVGVTQRTWSRWESGEMPMTAETLWRFGSEAVAKARTQSQSEAEAEALAQSRAKFREAFPGMFSGKRRRVQKTEDLPGYSHIVNHKPAADDGLDDPSAPPMSLADARATLNEHRKALAHNRALAQQAQDETAAREAKRTHEILNGT